MACLIAMVTREIIEYLVQKETAKEGTPCLHVNFTETGEKYPKTLANVSTVL